MTRQEYNRIILSILEKIVEKNPDLRFGQILVNADVIKLIPLNNRILVEDPFYEESKNMLERMSNNRSIELILMKENINKLYEIN